MKDQNCAYCMQGELVAKFGYPVCAMDTGYLYIFKDMYFFQQIFDCKKKKFRDMTRKDESGAKAREMWRDFFLSAFAGSWGIKVCINRMS